MRNQMKFVMRLIPALVIALLLIGGCSRFGRVDESLALKHPPQGEFVEPGRDIEQALRATVAKHLQPADTGYAEAPPQNARLVFARPYYFKEAVVYPKGLDSLDIDITPTDSITEPYNALVKIDKVIFSTDVKRKRQLAEADTNFKRLTGVSTLYYTFRNGRWTYTGSRFEALTTEEFAEGSWRPAQPKEIQTFSEKKEQEGILGKIWSSVFGR